jgi:hypothetical protein
MKNFVITSENQKQVNEAVVHLMDVLDNDISYEQIVEALFRGSSEFAISLMMSKEECFLFDNMIDMLCAIRCLMTGLEKFKDLKC